MALRFPRFFLILAALVVFAGIPSFAEFYTDWLWYRELGYEQVFLKSLSAQATTGMTVGAVVFVILWLNLRLSLRLLRRREFAIATPDGPRIITVDTGRLRSLIYVGALVAAGLIGLYSASSWATWLYAIHAVPFGRTDPVLGRDIAFYVFRLPMLELVHGIALIDRHPDDGRRRRVARRRGQPRARSAARRDRQPVPPSGIYRCSPPRSSWCWPSAPGCAFRIS